MLANSHACTFLTAEELLYITPDVCNSEYCSITKTFRCAEILPLLTININSITIQQKSICSIISQVRENYT